MFTLSIVNPIRARVRLDDIADAWEFLTALHNARSDLALLHAEEELAALKYFNSANSEAHFKAMCSAWAKANSMDAAINDIRIPHIYHKVDVKIVSGSDGIPSHISRINE